MRRDVTISAFSLVLALIGAVGGQAPVAAPTEPPEPLKGALVISGGGNLPDAAADAFVKLARGPKARLVVIPTAAASAGQVDAEGAAALWRMRGIREVDVLHARSRDEANAADFVKPLTEATAVWLGGGDQARLAAAYGGTRVETELHMLLGRGGVVGGTSAGAAVLSGLMIVGGAVVPRLEVGFGLLPGGVIDQHFLKRNRCDRLLEVLHRNPGWFGLGIDEGTAVIVQGRTLAVVGDSYAVAVLGGTAHRPASCQLLKAGDKADLIALARAAIERTRPPHPAPVAQIPNVPKGTLIIGGGGALPEPVLRRFIDLAGGPEARIAYIATALDDPVKAEPTEVKRFKQLGATNIKVLHAVNRAAANAPEFLAELRKASGVWFSGGRQWRFVDAYADTAAEKEFHAILARGGVIGGSSAGASIQADYMVRGDPQGNTKMMAEGYERGMGFLKGVAIDQHFAQRKRGPDMTELMARYPQLLGIGIDEGTALLVRGTVMEVVGKGNVAVYDRTRPAMPGEPDFALLPPNTRYDLKARKILEK
jgi:cyanophycinase